MFAFLMGFMASESWQNYSQAKTSIINETAAIERILNIPLKPEVFQVKSNDYVKSYLQSVLDDEWGAKHNQSSSVEAHESLNLLELNMLCGKPVMLALMVCFPKRLAPVLSQLLLTLKQLMICAWHENKGCYLAINQAAPLDGF